MANLNKKNKKNIVNIHNNFVEAIYSLSVDAKKILLSTFLHLDKDTGDITIHREELLQEIGIDPRKYRKEHLKAIFRELMTKVIEIKDLENPNNWVLLQLLKKVEYKDGYFRTSIYPELLPYFEEAQKKLFTKFNIQNIKPLTSIYAIRIYELCKRFHKDSRIKEISIDELKKILQIENKYKQISDFRKRVLEVAKKQINKNTDLEVDYELIKEGKKFTKVRFDVKQLISEKQIANKKENLKTLQNRLLKLYKGKPVNQEYCPTPHTWIVKDIKVYSTHYISVIITDSLNTAEIFMSLETIPKAFT